MIDFSKCLIFLVLTLSSSTSVNYGQIVTEQVAVKTKRDIAYIQNKGQWNDTVKFKAIIPGGALFITDEGFVYNFERGSDEEKIHQLLYKKGVHEQTEGNVTQERIHAHAYKVNFVNAKKPISYLTQGKRKEYHNYFIGNNKAKWTSNVNLYEQIIQKEVYAGIDAAIYSVGTSVKYDFIVAPHASPAQILLGFEGVQPELTAQGQLRIKTTINEVIEQAPYVYQIINGVKITIPSKYKLEGGLLSYELLANYDSDYELIIDPTLVFSTYSGSTGGGFYAYTTTYDQSGCLYAGAYGTSPGWPVSTGSYQIAGGGSFTVCINKFNTLGSVLLFSTYYGGSSIDEIQAMVCNKQNELTIIGSTKSLDLPVTTGCFDSTLNGARDLFVAHFNKAGTDLLGATYIGDSGEDEKPSDVALDTAGNIWVSGQAKGGNFPLTSNAIRSEGQGILFQLTADCRNLKHSTFMGDVFCQSVMVNNAGNIVVSGSVINGLAFSTTPGTLHDTWDERKWGFVSIIEAQTGALLQSTYLEGGAEFLQVDPFNNIVVMGRGENYPVSAGVYHNANGDIFIDKLSSDLSRSYLSTRIEGGAPVAFMYDICGRAYVATISPSPKAGLSTTTNAYEIAPRNLWFCVLEKGFQKLEYGTYFGSPVGNDHLHGGRHRFDPQGIMYMSVCGNSWQFPTTTGAVFPLKKNSGVDQLSFKFDFESPSVKARFVLPEGSKDTVCSHQPVTFLNESSFAKEYTWDFGDGSALVYDTNATHIFEKPGVYWVTLYARNDTSCNIADTALIPIMVLDFQLPEITVQDTVLCTPVNAIAIEIFIHNYSATQKILWEGNGIQSPADQAQIIVNPMINTIFYVTVSDSLPGICGLSVTDTLSIDLTPRMLDILNGDTAVCAGAVVPITAVGPSGYYRWYPTVGINDSTALEPKITVSQTEYYLLTVSYPGCPDLTDAIRIEMQELPQVELGPDLFFCPGNMMDVESLVIPYRNDYIYEWTSLPADSALGNKPNFYTIADTSRTYYLIVKTPIGCLGSDSLSITVYPPILSSVIADTGFCLPDSIPLWATGGLRYLWKPADGLSDINVSSPYARPEISTDYTVYVWDQFDCTDSQKVRVNVYPSAIVNMPDSVSLYPGERYHLEPETNCMYFEWFPPSGLNDAAVTDPWLSPEVRTRYFVTASTEQGCTVQDSIDVLVRCTQVAMPNAFMPGKGSSQDFRISGKGIESVRKFIIFNRWGEKVFETDNLSEGWNGTFKGQPQAVGVYMYLIELITACGDVQYQQGNVTLIR